MSSFLVDFKSFRSAENVILIFWQFTQDKKHSSKQITSVANTLEKIFFPAATFEGLRVVSIQIE